MAETKIRKNTLGALNGSSFYWRYLSNSNNPYKDKFQSGDFVYYYNKGLAFSVVSRMFDSDNRYIIQEFYKDGRCYEDRGVPEENLEMCDKRPPILDGMLVYAGKADSWRFASNVVPAYYNKAEKQFYYCVAAGCPLVTEEELCLLDAAKLPKFQALLICNKSGKGIDAVTRYDKKKKKVYYDVYFNDRHGRSNRKEFVGSKDTVEQVREYAKRKIRGIIKEFQISITDKWTWGDMPHFNTDTRDCYKDFQLNKPKFNMSEKAVKLIDILNKLSIINARKKAKYRK